MNKLNISILLVFISYCLFSPIFSLEYQEYLKKGYDSNPFIIEFYGLNYNDTYKFPYCFSDPTIWNMLNKSPNMIIIETSGASKTDSKNIFPTLIGGMLSILGGFLVALWNSRNESKKMRFEWMKFLFEKYEKNYLNFIKDLEGVSSVTQIERNYQQLASSSFIPLNLKRNIDDAIALLKNDDLNEEEKTIIRSNLIEDFENYIQDPWDYS